MVIKYVLKFQIKSIETTLVTDITRNEHLYVLQNITLSACIFASFELDNSGKKKMT